MSVPDLLRRAAQLAPSRPAIVDDRGVLTYRQFARRVQSLGQRWSRRPNGSRVLILLHNSRTLPEAVFGSSVAGLVPVLGDPGMPAAERDALIGRLDPSLIVCEEEIADTGIRALGSLTVETPTQIESLLAADRSWPGAWHANTSEPFVVVCTSGSTGVPKGVILSHSVWNYGAASLLVELGIRPGERALHVAPLFHGSLLLFTSVLMAVGTSVINERFESAAFLETVRRSRISTVFVVPTMLYDLLGFDEFSPDAVRSLRTIYYSGGPASPSLVRRAAARFGARLIQDYGLIEAPVPLLILGRKEHASLQRLPDQALAASIGRPSAWGNVALLRPDGQVAATGETGEIVTEGPFLMDGYLDDPEETALRLTGRRLSTGDLGTMGEDGFVYLQGRRSNLIVTGGKNVYADHVETTLSQCDTARQVVVVGVDDERWGEMMVGFVVSRPGAEGTVVAELQALAARQLAPYERPKRWFVRDAIPMSGTLKPRRSLLVALALSLLAAEPSEAHLPHNGLS